MVSNLRCEDELPSETRTPKVLADFSAGLQRSESPGIRAGRANQVVSGPTEF